jgi:vacuolar-type H+-ATPase subunit I/STV1
MSGRRRPVSANRMNRTRLGPDDYVRVRSAPPHGVHLSKGVIMPALLIIAIVLGVIFLFTGLFVTALKVLLWIGIVLVILAIIGWLLRTITGRRA